MAKSTFHSSPTFNSAHNISHRLAALKALHVAQGVEATEKIAHFAWDDLNRISESDIPTLSADATERIMQGWVYFAKHWEKGKDGPGEQTKSNMNAEDHLQAYCAFLKANGIAGEYPTEVAQKRGRLQRRS